MSNVADELLKLRFTPGPLASLYLNEDRVNERFTAHLGAITGWTQTAEKEGGGGVNLTVAKLDAKGSWGSQITYGVDHPLARALLLREALEAEGVVRTPAGATVGHYVIAAGRACLRHPEQEAPYPLVQMDHTECVPFDDPRYKQLEIERGRAEAMRLALAGPASSNDRMWLLVLTEGDEIRAASVLNSLWINDAVIRHSHSNWTMFGTLIESVADVPMFAAIHVWVTMPADVMRPADIG